ncbi:hypothetical protein C3486_36015 [Streptomyces sp. Ru73]|uniref:hypothetical protein n=1 Tax=Streptomyces sp. Ru73 TaxID=2080748 RepID=UPI000CDD71A5|nr:hypothetical protein [Streptomyces sp. Ru73]POX35971.1 hypothetical protein C3486_36015 [Streptomyces sp. Ru73]
MSTSALYERLVDDAGLFPPTQLEMAAAVGRHRADAAAGDPVLSHRFLCPAARLPELTAELAEADRFEVGLISPLEWGTLVDAHRRIAAEGRLRLVALEGPLPAAPDLVTGVRQAADALKNLPYGPPPGFPQHVEVPLTEGWEAALDELVAAGLAAKVRCGGVRAELFPAVGDLAAFVCACVRRGLPFKATAGLHHAVRYRDARTGFTHHGFLNLLLAACRAADGAAADGVEAVLRSTDPVALAAEARAVTPALAARTRAVFTGYGSCSTSEPLADLRALGLTGARPRSKTPTDRELDA